MDTEVKIIISTIMALLALIVIACHSGTRAKQLMLNELGVEATYWEASGMSTEFITGRLVQNDN